ncbi:MAG: PEP-CTERM sorting domain-containing protein [Acidobacteria bacterium]|nr:PEP-CTERM sorting domain-containing protein [Acidobacteriota bacterium]
MPTFMRWLAVLVIALTLPSPVQATPLVLDFEGLGEFDAVTTQFPGLTFSNATVLTAGSSLNEQDFPPKSGVNAVLDDGGPLTIAFNTPIAAFGGYFNYIAQLTLVAFDSANNPLGSVTSAFSANGLESGEPGSAPNELLQLSSLLGIASVVITGDPAGGSFFIDDATITPFDAPTPTPVPEPSSLLLVLGGASALLARRRRGAASQPLD